MNGYKFYLIHNYAFIKQQQIYDQVSIRVRTKKAFVNN